MNYLLYLFFIFKKKLYIFIFTLEKESKWWHDQKVVIIHAHIFFSQLIWWTEKLLLWFGVLKILLMNFGHCGIFLVCAAKPDFKKLFLSWPLGRHAHQKVTRFPGKFRLYVTFGLWCVTVIVCQKWKKSATNKNASRNFSLTVYWGRTKCWCMFYTF